MAVPACPMLRVPALCAARLTLRVPVCLVLCYMFVQCDSMRMCAIPVLCTCKVKQGKRKGKAMTNNNNIAAKADQYSAHIERTGWADILGFLGLEYTSEMCARAYYEGREDEQKANTSKALPSALMVKNAELFKLLETHADVYKKYDIVEVAELLANAYLEGLSNGLQGKNVAPEL